MLYAFTIFYIVYVLCCLLYTNIYNSLFMYNMLFIKYIGNIKYMYNIINIVNTEYSLYIVNMYDNMYIR